MDQWPEFQESLSDHSLFSFSTPQLEVEHTEWTFEENKLFENALAEFDHSSPAFFQNVASRVPWKSIDQIKNHYEALVEDIEMIESGHVPIPKYNETIEGPEGEFDQITNEKGSSSRVEKTDSNQQRRKGVPWTEEEHKLFLMGLNKYGKGDWRSISRYYVVTKSPTQVASHAQKFFRRKNSSTPADRRRPSIHDIQTVNSTSATMPQRHRNPPNTEDPVPISNPYGLPSLYNNIYNGELMTNFGQELGASTFPVANSMINQPSGAYQLPFFLPPFLARKRWG
ncbi:hypothetical protein F0562_004041 [Nyssa sinensis]|uniref:HTH myb-type domain-containing protein n=1 Tax=Nyssa sinensis TaxID=561372 RepID=A0A5J5C122_9ASTE|nr:hypothetical protein F0562_004041 [Nyssa sinensis]